MITEEKEVKEIYLKDSEVCVTRGIYGFLAIIKDGRKIHTLIKKGDIVKLKNFLNSLDIE